MKTTFDVLLLLFATFIITVFQQGSVFFQNSRSILRTVRDALQNPAWEAYSGVFLWARRAYWLIAFQYIVVALWLLFSVVVEWDLSRRGRLDITTRPTNLLKAYAVLSMAVLTYIIVSMVVVYQRWKHADHGNFPPDVAGAVSRLDGLLGTHYIFLGVAVFLVYLVAQVWKEDTINEYSVLLADRSVVVASLDGRSVQKFHLGDSLLKKLSTVMKS